MWLSYDSNHGVLNVTFVITYRLNLNFFWFFSNLLLNLNAHRNLMINRWYVWLHSSDADGHSPASLAWLCRVCVISVLGWIAFAGKSESSYLEWVSLPPKQGYFPCLARLAAPKARLFSRCQTHNLAQQGYNKFFLGTKRAPEVPATKWDKLVNPFNVILRKCIIKICSGILFLSRNSRGCCNMLYIFPWMHDLLQYVIVIAT
jgi:hypothetical protein